MTNSVGAGEEGSPQGEIQTGGVAKEADRGCEDPIGLAHEGQQGGVPR